MISSPKGRLFLFIDETGDPGILPNSSIFYGINIIIVHRDDLKHLQKQIAAFRYFKNSGKELKRHMRDMSILKGVFDELSSRHIIFVSFLLFKEDYINSFLGKFNILEKDFSPSLFRDFVLRQSFEFLFCEVCHIEESQGIELVFDRYLESECDEEKLKNYLRKNHKLPYFDKIVQIDSEYCDALQLADYLGHFAKKMCIDKSLDPEEVNFGNMFQLADVESVLQIKKPRTP